MRSSHPDALIVGESLIDIIVTPDGQQEQPGGSPMNVAYGLARLGLDTQLHTQIGSDDRGRAIQTHLVAAGVDLDPASETGHLTSTAIATIRNGSAEYEFDITWDLEVIAVPEHVRLVHTGSIASVLEPGAESVFQLCDTARHNALVSFDPNVRPQVTSDRDAVLTHTDKLARVAHIVKMSDEDASWLHPDLSLDAVLDRYLSLGAALVAITQGDKGCLIASATHRLDLAAPRVDVVDTVGAGDAFMSGLLFAILSNDLDTRLRIGAIAIEDLEGIANLALYCARITVSRAGATPPSLAELVRALAFDTSPSSTDSQVTLQKHVTSVSTI